MAESRRRTRSRKAQPEGQAQPEPVDDGIDQTSDRISDATTVYPPATAIEVFEESQPPSSEDAVGVNADTDVTTIHVEESETGGFKVRESSDAINELFQCQEFVEQLAAAMITDGKAADRLLCAFSDKLQDRIKDDPEFKRKLLTCATSNPGFRGKVVKALAKAMR